MMSRLHDKRAAKSKTRPAFRLLVVDDELTVRQLLVEALSDEGHAVAQAGNAAEALALLRAERFDLLITDLGLPGGMTGLQLAAAALAVQPGLRLLAITGYLERAPIALGGVTIDVLVKPFKLDVLCARVAAQLV